MAATTLRDADWTPSTDPRSQPLVVVVSLRFLKSDSRLISFFQDEAKHSSFFSLFTESSGS